jgi:3-hydroxyacyl-[acyl-carrier-protein] dehydratase
VKNVSFNEPFFQGHFPRSPVMPGVLILEALAQATGILAFRTENWTPNQTSIFYLVGIDNARFKRPVRPGDQLILTVTLHRQKRGIWMFSGQATVDGKIVASADIMSTKREVD